MAIYNKPTSDNSFINGTDFSGTTLVGGDTILYAVGSHTNTQRFEGYHGDSEQNPIIIDLNGQDIDGLNNNIVIRLVDCSHILIRNGTVRNSSTQGVYSTESKGVVVENISVYNCVGTGIRIGWQSALDTPSSWRASTFDPYAKVRNCYVDTITSQGEGIYIGPSNGDRWYFSTDGNSTPLQLAYVLEAEVSNCFVTDTDYDGIQVGGIIGKAIIRNNIIENYGVGDNSSHNNGIQLGKCAVGYVYNNIIRNSSATAGAAMQLQGSNYIAFNNVMHDVYTGIHIFSDLSEGNQTAHVFNNTIVDANLHGIYFNARQLRNMKLYNNIVHMVNAPSPPSYYDIREVNSPDYIESNNIFVNGAGALTGLDFADYANKDFSLGVSSSALGAGLNLSHLDSRGLINYAGDLRSLTGSWNIGAY